MVKISPSLLSADMGRLAESVEMVKDVADYIHCDVMDGHFVPNLTIGIPIIKALKKHSKLPLDVHLMIEDPGLWVDRYIDTGLDENDFLVFHFEAEKDPLNVLKRIRERGVRPGLSIKPATTLEAVTELIPYLDQLLIMTVEPGFEKQKFLSGVVPKIEKARALYSDGIVIAVDGGINTETAAIVCKAGARMLIAGGAVYGMDDPVQAIRDIRRGAEFALR